MSPRHDKVTTSLQARREDALRGRFAAIALICMLVAAMAALGGCGSADAGSASSSASSSAQSSEAEQQAPEQESITLRVAAPMAMEGVLDELADAYSTKHDGVAFNILTFNSAKKENEAIALTEKADDGTESAFATSESSQSEASEAGDAEEAEPAKAEIVFEPNATAMDDAEKVGAVDSSTRSDMIQENLVIVASSDTKLSTVTTADIQAGSVKLAVVSGDGQHAKRQFEALQSIGVYDGSAFTGYYATEAKTPVVCDSVAALFSALAKDEECAALVGESDLYRYGGAKIIGAVPADMYTAMRFPQALGANISLLENGEKIEQTARDFLAWMETDEDALGIIEKWGFEFAA